MARADSFDPGVALPPGLEIGQIRKAIDFIERELVEWVDLYAEQANVFSAVVGILGAKALDQVSNYERHRNIDTMQQRFPDLKRRGSGPNPSANHCLESKASKRDWPIQSHYDHPGWYIIWRYLVDVTMTLEPRKPIVIWRVDVVFLEKADWKYEPSKAGEAGGGRTHTFSVKTPSKKLQGKAVYQRRDVILRGGKPIPRNGEDDQRLQPRPAASPTTPHRRRRPRGTPPPDF